MNLYEFEGEHVGEHETQEAGDQIERIEFEDGIKLYIKGHVHPIKGLPKADALHSINFVKRLLMGKPVDAMWIALKPFILKTEYQMALTREISRVFPSKMGIIIAHVLEYDSAYRFRFQDLASETTKERLLANPVKEMRRLIEINRKRDYNDVAKKIRKVAYILMILLFIPSFRKKIRELDFTKLQLDEIDTYWLGKRTDYKL